jgi:RimJ/RimL family protein N-acetyltransferase
MNDRKVTCYLESRFSTHSITSLREYVEKTEADPNTIFFAIALKTDHTHIGNIKLASINRRHGFGDIGVLIGEKTLWGKGYAAEAINLLKAYAFNTLHLHKLTAGCYANNEGSKRAFQKCGFEIEGILKEHCLWNGQYVDVVLFGLIDSKFRIENEPTTLSNL